MSQQLTSDGQGHLKAGDRVVYTGPCRDVGGVKTGATGVVDRVVESGDIAEVRWDVVEAHAVSWKDRWYLEPQPAGEAAVAKPRAAH